MIYPWDGRGIGMHIAKWAIHMGGKLGWAGAVDLYKGLEYKSWPIPCPYWISLEILFPKGLPA